MTYASLAVWATWPLGGGISHSLTIGTESTATVPLFTAWTVGWNATAASRAWHGYWDAPIFFPESNAFAFSEPIPISVVVAPLVWLTGNVVLSHNVFLLTLLVLNGLFGYFLLSVLRCNRLASVICGAWFVLMPAVNHEIGVLQLVGIFGIASLPTLLVAIGVHPSIWRAFALGIVFAVTHASCGNYGVYASVLLVLVSPLALFSRVGIHWRLLASVLSAAVAVLLLSPLLRVQHHVAEKHGLVRPIGLVSRLSASPLDYMLLSEAKFWEPPTLIRHRLESKQRLGIGLGLPVLACIGAVCGMMNAPLRRWTAVTIATAIAAFLLSLGPDLKLWGWSPYETLWHHYPGFSKTRSPFRFAMVVQAMVVLLAGLGLSTLLVYLAGLPRCKRRFALAGMLFVVVIGCFYELTPPARPLYAPSSIQNNTGWIKWIRENTNRDDVVVCLPFPTSGTVHDFQRTAEWMLAGYFHERRIVNGYSGFLPDGYFLAKSHLATFPDSVAIDWLCKQDVRYCVVDRRHFRQVSEEYKTELDSRVVFLFSDESAMIDIYKIVGTDGG